MPDVMAAAHVVEPTGTKALGDLTRVQTGARHVDDQALGDGCVEVLCPLDTARVCELAKWQEASQC